MKAPNELTSRYVPVGQRIGNGQVLVKRIEMQNNNDPVVVLQEKGIEVPKTVGSAADIGESEPGEQQPDNGESA